MLQALRDKMKLVLLIVLIAFVATIIFSWGMGGFKNRSQAQQGIVGVIAGQKIMYQQFQQAVQQKYEERKSQGSEDLSDYQRKMIRDQVWNEFVRNILLADEVRRLGIEVTAEEVVFQLRNNPPEYIQTAEQFQTEGRFDIQKYHQALADPRNYDLWIPIENYLKSTLPMQKLYQQVAASIRISDSEILDDYKKENETVNARYLFFDTRSQNMDSVTVEDKAVRAYYKAHKSDYQVPEKRIIQYIKFDSVPSRDDSSQTRSDMNDIIEQLKKGADFEEMALDYSEDDGSKDKGGDLGFFGKNQMVKPFSDAAFSAKVGDIVGPIETQHGVHVLQVIARKKEKGEQQIHARHILLKYKVSPDSYDSIYENAKYAASEAKHLKGAELDSFAVRENLSLTISPAFEEGGFIPGLGMASRVNYLTFQEDEGWVSDPLYVNKDVIVFRIQTIEKEHYRPLDDVKEEIITALKKEKSFETAKEACHEAAAAIKSGQNLAEAAEALALEIQEPDPFALQAYVSGVGRDAAFNGTAFGLDINEISGPVKGQNGYYIIQTLNKNEADMAGFEAVKENRKQRLLQQKQQQVYMAWFEALKDKADIVDNRNAFY